MNVYCPKCGKPMNQASIQEDQRSGNLTVTYVCPNRYKCGTIIRKIEKR